MQAEKTDMAKTAGIILAGAVAGIILTAVVKRFAPASVRALL